MESVPEGRHVSATRGGGERRNKVISAEDLGSGWAVGGRGHTTCPASQRPKRFSLPTPVLTPTSGEHLSSKEIFQHRSYVILT